MGQKKRRQYSAEFKAEAVKLVLEHGLSRAQASRDLGVTERVLCRWVQAAVDSAVPGALSASERQELRRLRRENATLRKERDITSSTTLSVTRESACSKQNG